MTALQHATPAVSSAGRVAVAVAIAALLAGPTTGFAARGTWVKLASPVVRVVSAVPEAPIVADIAPGPLAEWAGPQVPLREVQWAQPPELQIAAAAPAAAGPRRSGVVSAQVTVTSRVASTPHAGVRAQSVGALEPFSYREAGNGSIVIDPSWVVRHITTATVPVVGAVRCHRAMVGPLQGALTEVVARGLADRIDVGDFGGCWVPRHIDRDPAKPLSMHAWGLAVDFNVSTNGLGARPTIDRDVVAIFESWGFRWGGHWDRPDGMHFELARAGSGGDPAVSMSASVEVITGD